ncbi:M14 family metallocarboxypeptidase [Xanthomonas campestris pv. campestris]|uniref:M14 family metallopeptidase n=1 Tax=Xanthomonas campestris TaxID=339 RepID=UPI000676C747|nr:M14 family metallocarboxypeptidase [Xanthomonas campestris]AKS16286.1 peptidase [Xanthomonas campestris pv. campestris]MCC5047210.1 M14 family metallocarboxypeptidase [Xanthomonas campestris]MCC5056396.1 M14 family metallocarboxypeptidase [Xanthomonas campestris]MCC5060419.1 M14 family metallocarboxypeptidase [Xanthomonas campestris]MCF8809967.1 M14 family metallocarboxypeptidase [Xanthomonas campestris pv. campestris]
MTEQTRYPIGSPGQAWGETERAQWRARQVRRRVYADDVLQPVAALAGAFECTQYGVIGQGADTYPLMALRTPHWDATLPWALVTGGVHGYETSGVLGALQFLQERAAAYAGRINLLVVPCVNPWGYERIQRWNAEAIDPNRAFRPNSPAAESAALMQLVTTVTGTTLLHIDLHETTDSDETEFRPALAARDGVPFVPGSIPDGFYLVGDSDDPQPAFQQAVIAAVAQVTHIAPADAQGEIIGAPVVGEGVINYPVRRLGLCAGVTEARYRTTTEVYPDSPRATPAQCNLAQVVVICAALDCALANT